MSVPYFNLSIIGNLGCGPGKLSLQQSETSRMQVFPEHRDAAPFLPRTQEPRPCVPP